MTISKKRRRFGARAVCGTLAGASLWISRAAVAQTPPTPAPAAPAESEPSADEAPPSAPPTTADTAQAPAAAAAPPAPAEVTPPAAASVAEPPPAEAAPPKAAEKKLPSIDVGAWVRVGMQFQGSSDPKKLNDQHFDTVYGELHLSGKVHEMVGYTFNFNANAPNTNTPQAQVGIMDAIVQLDFLDELHLWSGQLLVPVDRTNFSGPFFISPWTYPGVFTVPGPTGGAVISTPNEGEGPAFTAGRSIGSVLWGDFGKGLFKYYASVMNLARSTESPLFSGRLNFAPIGGEPGYYSSSQYYGEKDVLAIGVGGQFKNNGSVAAPPAGGGAAPAPDDYTDVNADVLATFNVGDAGAITAEGAFYHFSGRNEMTHDMFFVLGSFLTPKVGVGKFEPMVRYEQATGDNNVKASQIDAHVAYVLDGAKMRGLVGFTHTDLRNDVQGNAIQIGLQTIQF